MKDVRKRRPVADQIRKGLEDAVEIDRLVKHVLDYIDCWIDSQVDG